MLDKEKHIRPDIEGEIEEIQRFSQELSRDEGIEVSVDEVIDSLEKSEEQLLTDDIWNVLENTESNEVEEGDWETVEKIAREYKKTSPKVLKKEIESGEYKRPLIAKLDGRYVLMAGNTRLCTAAAMGVNLNVFIGNIGDKINETEEIKGGLADNKSLVQIAKKHNAKGYYHIQDMVKSLNKQLDMGLKVEMEHTDDKDKAKEIALDHLWEDPNYYSKLKKIETKESMGADSAGAFVGSAFGSVIKKKDLYKPNNFKKYNVNEEEVKEATDASSSGAYDAPFGNGGKNPLKINGEKSVKNSRAVKDKNFPKWGGPGGIFIKIKEKCKKYPYCNQGDINAIELLEIKNDVIEISDKYGIPYKEMEKIVLNEINKIFISMNLSDINSLIESIASEEIKRTIISESEGGKKQVYHIKLDGEPLETFNSKEEAEEALPNYKAKEKGELIIEPEIYESYEDMIEKMDQMGQELEEKENQNMENQEPMEGNAFAYAALKAKEAGEETFEFDGETHNVQESWKQLEEEEGMCNECGDSSMDMKEGEGMCNECGSMLNEEGMCSECGSMMNESKTKKKVLRLSESEMVNLIKKMVKESVPGLEVTKRAQTQSKKDNEENAKEVGKKIQKATTVEGSDNPEFPHQNNSGTKVARQNNEEENEFVEDNRGGKSIDLDYDYEPSKRFKERLKSALEGDSKMGNSQEAANVVKSDLGKKLSKQAERKEKKEEKAPMYNKDAQPVEEVNESEVKSSSLLKEEIEKMKKIASYNKKTQ